MTQRNLWDRYRAWIVDDPELSFRLDVSRMDLPDDYDRAMEAQMRRAFDAMEVLEKGGIANPDEHRMVGHYWLRAPDLAPTPEIEQSIRQTLEHVLAFAASVHDGRIRPTHADRFERLLVIGIGGSALGPQLVAKALGTGADKLRPHFLDNTDPDGIDRILDGLGDGLKKTLTGRSSSRSPAAPRRRGTACSRRPPRTAPGGSSWRATPSSSRRREARSTCTRASRASSTGSRCGTGSGAAPRSCRRSAFSPLRSRGSTSAGCSRGRRRWTR
jgi:glucose-6-phosphate isomerase